MLTNCDVCTTIRIYVTRSSFCVGRKIEFSVACFFGLLWLDIKKTWRIKLMSCLLFSFVRSSPLHTFHGEKGADGLCPAFSSSFLLPICVLMVLSYMRKLLFYFFILEGFSARMFFFSFLSPMPSEVWEHAREIHDTPAQHLPHLDRRDWLDHLCALYLYYMITSISKSKRFV